MSHWDKCPNLHRVTCFILLYSYYDPPPILFLLFLYFLLLSGSFSSLSLGKVQNPKLPLMAAPSVCVSVCEYNVWVCMCEWVKMVSNVKRFEWSIRVEKHYTHSIYHSSIYFSFHFPIFLSLTQFQSFSQSLKLDLNSTSVYSRERDRARQLHLSVFIQLIIHTFPSNVVTPQLRKQSSELANKSKVIWCV